MAKARTISRRKALKAVAAAVALPLVHVRTAGAAGKLSLGLWDHWVPAANDVMKKQVAEWGEKNKVEVKLDLINTLGQKHLITTAAEAQAKSGHDAMVFIQWDALNHAQLLEPMDDVVAGWKPSMARPMRFAAGSARWMGIGAPCRPAPVRRTRGRAGASAF